MKLGNDPYGFVRDGQWHELTIPLADFTGVNLSGVETLLSINGTGNISDLALSDIYFEYTGTNQPVLTSIDVSPTNATINQGQTQQFSAQGFDQNGDPISTSVSWSAAGGTINSNGLFTGSDNGTFIISATSEGLTGTASITVNEVISGISIPGTIEVEDYDNYYDTSAGNSGGAYRNDDVDIEATGDATGAYNVGWTAAGEWLEYTIYASASSALYDISARLASPSGTGQLHVEIDGVDVSGPINAPNTRKLAILHHRNCGGRVYCYWESCHESCNRCSWVQYQLTGGKRGASSATSSNQHHDISQHWQPLTKDKHNNSQPRVWTKMVTR